MVLKRHVYFLHKRLLESLHPSRPQCCVVTRRRGRGVYYRPFYGLSQEGCKIMGSPSYFDIEDAHKWVGEIVVKPWQQPTKT